MRVSFLNPGSADEPFFGKLASFMQIAADQLGVELEVIDCHRDRAKVIREGEALVARPARPDYLILGNPEGAAVELLPRVHEAGIQSMLINEAIMSYDYQKVGRPRQRLSSWLGQLLPDDQEAGDLLAGHLLESASRAGCLASDGTIHMAALAGDYSSSSNFRVVGLNRVVKARNDVTLNSVRLGQWSRETARELTTGLLKLFPETSVIWAASDLMAAGAIEAIQATGRTPGDDVFVGGVDWAPQAYDRLRDGTLTASVGGHFMEGAWAIVMLYDRHNGKDFKTIEFRSSFAVLTADNVGQFSMMFEQERWAEADFTRLSKVENPAVESYAFSPTAAFNGGSE